MLGRRLSWRDAAITALLWGLSSSSGFEVELEGPTRLDSHRENIHREETLTGRLR